ncbi:peptidoglycan hydrolase-like protein with peptidoglycan-binding domain [Sphingobium sp. OAS761]|nr:peptidoglycan hydrolase-like protein with peptidoglycan-binding domain [Sphingobium sp. OAS761]
MRNYLLLPVLLCSACHVTVTDANESEQANAARSAERVPTTVTSAKADDFEIVPEQTAWQANRILQAQVALDRWGFSPGVLDGKDGMSFKAALRGFQAGT